MDELPASFLAALDPDDLEALRARAAVRSFRCGDTLLHQDDDPGRVLVVERGRVKVSHLAADGRETIFGYREAGDLVGEFSALDGGRGQRGWRRPSPCRRSR
jgi:CRP-like cAMP-binding protein